MLSPTAVLILCVAGVFFAIFMGFKFNHNVGLWCYLFAYLIGCFGLGLKPSALVKMWPTTFTFIIMSISFFYGFASQNGVLALLSKKILYTFRKVSWLLPWMIYFLSFFLAMSGTGAAAATAIMAPIGFSICLTAGLSPLLTIAAVMLPAPPGAFAPWCSGAALVRSALESTQWGDYATELLWPIWLNGFICSFIIFAVVYVVLKGYKAQIFDMEKPEPFNATQKKLLVICACVTLGVILPPIIRAVFGISPTWFNYMDIQFLALAGGLLCSLLKLGDEKKLIRENIPWSLVFMVTGIVLLMGVAAEGGAVDLIASFLSTSLPTNLIPPALVVVAGFMSFFAGGMTVVSPMLLPLVEPIFNATGLSPIVCSGAICFGANTTGMSPFSTGGSMTLGFYPDEATRPKIMIQQFLMVCLCWVLMILLSFLGLFGLFTFGLEF